MVELLDRIIRSAEPPRDIVRGGSTRSDAIERAAVVTIAVVAVISRLATTIHYVEDLDSLHFALAMVELDIAALQPHFPGYLVFVGLAKLLAALTGSFAVAFSLVGAGATALLVVGMLRIAQWRAASLRGVLLAVVLSGSAMLWLYANRYMPDLLGTALLVWSLHDLTSDDDRLHVRGAFVAALLAGTRLSYMPFLVPAALATLAWRRHRAWALLAFVAGVVLWAIPLVVSTGWSEIVAIAANQTAGHFDEFGGTVRTEPDLMRRTARMIEGIWTDGLAGYLPGRGVPTLIAGAGTLLAVLLAMPALVRSMRRRRWRIIAAGIVCYGVWIFLFQNVIYHTRHLLPLVPFVLLAAVVGLARLIAASRRNRASLAVAVALVATTIVAHLVVGSQLAWQHREPSAIALASRALTSSPKPVTIVSTALVNYYLASTGVDARFIAVDRPGVADSITATASSERVVSVGDYRGIVRRPVESVTAMHHNPYVNRIWPRIELYEYQTGAQR